MASVYIPAGANVSADQIRETSLDVQGTLTINNSPAGIFDPTHASLLDSLTIEQDSSGNYLGTLDIGNNALIIHADASDYMTVYNQVDSAIKSGFHGGDWRGTGITSSLAAEDAQNSDINAGNSAIGIIKNSDIGFTKFAGQIVGPYDIMVAFTVYGDSLFQGNVNGDDWTQFVGGLTDPTDNPPTWVNGDYDYNGVVNGDDWSTFTQAFSANLHPTVSAQPEGTRTKPNLLASFTESPSGYASNFLASINWGEGNPAMGAIVMDPDGTVEVFGDHTYNTPGLYSVNVMLGGPTAGISNGSSALVNVSYSGGLLANYVSPTEIDLSWSSIEATHGNFQIESENGTGWFPIGSAPDNSTGFVAHMGDFDVPFQPSTIYSFRVGTLINGSSEIDYGNVAEITTPAFAMPPTFYTATPISASEIDLSWDYSDTPQSFVIERTDATGTNLGPIATVPGDLRSFQDINLPEATTFTYVINAESAAGSSPSTYSIQATTFPDAPTDLEVSDSGTGGGIISWTNTSSAATNNEVDYSTDGGQDWSVLASPSVSGPAVASLTFDPGIFAGAAPWDFRVRASVFANNSGFIDDVFDPSTGNNSSTDDPSDPTTPALIPGTPVGFTATNVTDSEVDLAWQPADNAATGFVIQRSDNSYSWTTIATIDDGRSTAFADTTVSPDQQYYYEIAATNASGQSSFADTSATTLPASPSNLQATAVSIDEIDLSWSGSDRYIGGYLIQQSTDGVNWTDSTIQGSVQEATTAILHGPFDYTHNYFFRVRAQAQSLSYSAPPLSDAAYSNEVTIPLPPSGAPSPGRPTNPAPMPQPPLDPPPPGDDWVLVDVVSVPTEGPGNSGVPVETIPTDSGATYALVATGVAQDGIGGCDANYGVADNSGTWVHSAPDGVDFCIELNGSEPAWGGYNPGHVYNASITGTGSSMTVNYSEDVADDNSGDLTMFMFELITIGSDGPGGPGPGPGPGPDPGTNTQPSLEAIRVQDEGHSQNYVTAVIQQNAPPVDIYLPEDSSGHAGIEMSNAIPGQTDWSISGSSADPASGTFSRADQVVTLDGSGGNTNFTLTLTDDNTNSSATVNIHLQPWEIDAYSVQDNHFGSLLSMTDKSSEGAFVPVDDGDSDYNGNLDDANGGPQDHTAAPPSVDDRLLPIDLRGTGDPNAGDYYTINVNVSSDIRVFEKLDGKYQLVSSTDRFKATNDTTLYVEGMSTGVVLLPVNWTTNGTTYTNIDYLQAAVFEMTGPLNVPGNGVYEYTASAPDTLSGGNLLPSGSKFVNPSGGTIQSGANSSDISILWNNQAIVGNPKYYVNSEYQWDMDVNVVAINIDYTVANDFMKTRQGAAIQQFTVASNPNQLAMYAQLYVSFAGPTPVNGGPMRGVSHLQAGFMQFIQLAEDYTDYQLAGSRIQNSISGATVYLDQRTQGPVGMPFPSVYPWYDSNNWSADGEAAAVPGDRGPDSYVDFSNVGIGHAPINVVFQFGDAPVLFVTDADSVNNDPATSVGLVLNFQDFFAVQTTDNSDGANKVYVDEAAAGWKFDGSGAIVNGVWTPPNVNLESTVNGSDPAHPDTGSFVAAVPGTSVMLPTNTDAFNDIYNPPDNNWPVVPIPQGG